MPNGISNNPKIINAGVIMKMNNPRYELVSVNIHPIIIRKPMVNKHSTAMITPAYESVLLKDRGSLIVLIFVFQIITD